MLGVWEGVDMHSFVCLPSRLSYTHLTMANLKGLCSVDRLVADVLEQQQLGDQEASAALKGGCQHAWPIQLSFQQHLEKLAGQSMTA